MNPQQLTIVLTALAILFWGGAATAFKIALTSLTPLNLLVLSSWISLIFLLSMLIVTGQWRALKQVKTLQIVPTLLLGVLNPALYYLVLFKAYALLPGQIAMSLNYLWPVMLGLLSVPILGHTLGWFRLVAMLISFSGAVVIATSGALDGLEQIDQAGLILALSSTLIWAVYWLLNRKIDLPASLKLTVGFCSGTLTVTTYALVSEAVPVFSQINWIAVTYVGLFEMGLTFFLWLKALQLSTNAARLGQWIYLTPFLSLVFLSWIYGEPTQTSTIFGLALIILGLMLPNLKLQKTVTDK